MDPIEQARIPPPIQHDGLRRPSFAPVARADDGNFYPHFDIELERRPRRLRRYAQRVNRQLSPVMLVVGYLTSAGAGVGLAYLLLREWGYFE